MAENINKKKLYVEGIGDVVSVVTLLLTLPVISAAFLNIVKNLIALIMPKNLFADSNKSKVGNFVTNTILPKIQIAIDNIDKWATKYIDGLVFVLKKIPKLKTKDESELRHIAITIYYTITIGLLMKVAKLILYKKGLIGDGAALKSIRDIITNGLKLGSYDLDFDDIEKESDIMFSTKGLAPIIKEIVDFFLKQLHITEDTYNHMNKNVTNETFKKHLGLLHKKLNEDTGDIVSMIERYIEIIETLKSVALSYDGDTPSLEDEKRNIKKQIISSKGQEYFNMVDELAELKVRKGNQSKVDALANQLGLPQLALSEVTTDGGSLPELALKGAEVIDVMTSSDGKVHLRIKAANSTQLYDAVLV